MSESTDRALYDVLCQLDQWFRDHDSVVVPCEADHSCAALIELFRSGKQAEMCKLMNSQRESSRRGRGPRSYWGSGGYCGVTSQNGLLLVAITLKAIEANVGGRFSVSTNLDLCVECCDSWLLGNISIKTGQDFNRFNAFYKLVTGLVPPPSCTPNAPVLVCVAGTVIYNDYDFSADPHSIPYCKISEGAAYTDDELVEFVASTPAKQCFCDSQAVKGEMLPLDLTPTELNVVFSRGINEDGEFNLELIVEGSNGRHFLNTRNGLALWPNLVFARPLPRFTTNSEVHVISPGCAPHLARVGRRVAAAFKNHKGRCIACCCSHMCEDVFLLVESGTTTDGRLTYDYIVKHPDISRIVY